MPREKDRFQYASDQSLIVYLGTSINVETHHRLMKLLHLTEAHPIPGVRNLHPAYCSMLVVFDPMRQDHATIEKTLQKYIAKLDKVTLPTPRTVEIPVCYGGEYGPDLAEVARLHGMSEPRAIELHSGADYIVYFIGFVPGFAYLGGLPAELATPRLETPRKRVPARSVAIGGDQTGVYPFETPGGWRLIGATPMPIIDRASPEISRLRIGDRVRFTPIPASKFPNLQRRFL